MKVLLMQYFQTAATVLTHRLPHSAKPHARILPQRGIRMAYRKNHPDTFSQPESGEDEIDDLLWDDEEGKSPADDPDVSAETEYDLAFPEKHRSAHTEGAFHLGTLNKVLAVAIAAGVAAIVIWLFVWNIGEKSVWNRNETTTDYDIEVQDVIVAQNPKDLEGHTDDGVTNILFLGNDLISDDETESGIAGQVASLGNVQTITAAFPGSQITCFNTDYKTDSQHDMDDIYNFFYVANCISTGDFSALSNVAAYHSDTPVYADAASTLAGIDWNTIDMIAISYNAADYLNGSAVWNDANDLDIVTYTGALRLGIRRIHEKYPWIRLVFLSPTYTRIEDQSGTLQNGDTTNIGNGDMSTYWLKAVDVCVGEQVSFLDNYYGSINGQNYQEYMTDGVHLNSAGNTAIARHFVYKIIENGQAEYNFRTGTGSDVAGDEKTEE